eukprot:scaffold89832_cov60-Phaeocystis_antarctica.AAC.2
MALLRSVGLNRRCVNSTERSHPAGSTCRGAGAPSPPRSAASAAAPAWAAWSSSHRASASTASTAAAARCASLASAGPARFCSPRAARARTAPLIVASAHNAASGATAPAATMACSAAPSTARTCRAPAAAPRASAPARSSLSRATSGPTQLSSGPTSAEASASARSSTAAAARSSGAAQLSPTVAANASASRPAIDRVLKPRAGVREVQDRSIGRGAVGGAAVQRAVRAQAELGGAVVCAEVDQRHEDRQAVAGQVALLVQMATVHVPLLVGLVVRVHRVAATRHDLTSVQQLGVGTEDLSHRCTPGALGTQRSEGRFRHAIVHVETVSVAAAELLPDSVAHPCWTSTSVAGGIASLTAKTPNFSKRAGPEAAHSSRATNSASSTDEAMLVRTGVEAAKARRRRGLRLAPGERRVGNKFAGAKICGRQDKTSLPWPCTRLEDGS